MSKIICAKCGSEISDQSANCVICGFPIEDSKRKVHHEEETRVFSSSLNNDISKADELTSEIKITKVTEETIKQIKKEENKKNKKNKIYILIILLLLIVILITFILHFFNDKNSLSDNNKNNNIEPLTKETTETSNNELEEDANIIKSIYKIISSKTNDKFINNVSIVNNDSYTYTSTYNSVIGNYIVEFYKNDEEMNLNKLSVICEDAECKSIISTSKINKFDINNTYKEYMDSNPTLILVELEEDGVDANGNTNYSIIATHKVVHK